MNDDLIERAETQGWVDAGKCRIMYPFEENETINLGKRELQDVYETSYKKFKRTKAFRTNCKGQHCTKRRHGEDETTTK